jgi:hypothetical protein
VGFWQRLFGRGSAIATTDAGPIRAEIASLREALALTEAQSARLAQDLEKVKQTVLASQRAAETAAAQVQGLEQRLAQAEAALAGRPAAPAAAAPAPAPAPAAAPAAPTPAAAPAPALPGAAEEPRPRTQLFAAPDFDAEEEREQKSAGRGKTQLHAVPDFAAEEEARPRTQMFAAPDFDDEDAAARPKTQVFAAPVFDDAPAAPPAPASGAPPEAGRPASAAPAPPFPPPPAPAVPPGEDLRSARTQMFARPNLEKPPAEDFRAAKTQMFAAGDLGAAPGTAALPRCARCGGPLRDEDRGGVRFRVCGGCGALSAR